MRDGNALASKRVMVAMPERAASMFAHAAESPIPTGDTMPIPVTTTRRLDMVCATQVSRGERAESPSRGGRSGGDSWSEWERPGAGPGRVQGGRTTLLLDVRADVV